MKGSGGLIRALGVGCGGQLSQSVVPVVGRLARVIDLNEHPVQAVIEHGCQERLGSGSGRCGHVRALGLDQIPIGVVGVLGLVARRVGRL